MSAARDWPHIVDAHLRVVAELRQHGALLDRVVSAIVAAIRGGGRVLILGNGGSAADAQHIAGEFVGRFKLDRQPLPAIALTTDTSTLTAIANDYAYEQVFARQVRALARPGDVVWALSTSGNSPNVLAAILAARDARCVIVGFSGHGGGAMASLCDHLFCAPHNDADRIQEAHMLAYHYVCERVEREFSPGSG